MGPEISTNTTRPGGNSRDNQLVVPESLWRAFSVDPSKLSIYSLSQTLRPGTIDPNDPTKIGDGNELGVYMSTNRSMVEYAYAHTSRNISVTCPRYDDRGSMTNKITLPQCGVVVEVHTKGLDVREPYIKPSLQGHYNNGFEGRELIADAVPRENFSVRKLILSRYANDSQTFVVDVADPATHHAIEKAVSIIQAEFNRRKSGAEEFAKFLEGLTQEQRSKYLSWRRAWQEHLESKYVAIP